APSVRLRRRAWLEVARILLLFSSNLERFARLYSLRRHTRVNMRHARWSRGDSERNCDPEGKIMTVLEASKSTNARKDGSAALRVGQTACSSPSPMCQSARTRTSRPSEISFLAAPTVIETGPSPATAAANPTSLKVTTSRPLTVTEVAFPLLVNDHERPSPDGATQGSSV